MKFLAKPHPYLHAKKFTNMKFEPHPGLTIHCSVTKSYFATSLYCSCSRNVYKILSCQDLLRCYHSTGSHSHSWLLRSLKAEIQERATLPEHQVFSWCCMRAVYWFVSKDSQHVSESEEESIQLSHFILPSWIKEKDPLLSAVNPNPWPAYSCKTLLIA